MPVISDRTIMHFCRGSRTFIFYRADVHEATLPGRYEIDKEMTRDRKEVYDARAIEIRKLRFNTSVLMMWVFFFFF